MATSAISQNHVDLLQGVAHDCGAIHASSHVAPDASADGASLGAARAVIAAVGLEAMFAACVCGAWGLWHLLR